MTPSKQLTPTIAKITAADIIVTAAQGNDDQALQTGARMFNVASPGAFDEVFSIGHVNNTANPGSVLMLDKAVPTASGKRNKIGEWLGCCGSYRSVQSLLKGLHQCCQGCLECIFWVPQAPGTPAEPAAVEVQGTCM